MPTATLEPPAASTTSQAPAPSPEPSQAPKAAPTPQAEAKNEPLSPFQELDNLANPPKENSKPAPEPLKKTEEKEEAVEGEEVTSKTEENSPKVEEPKPAGTAKELRAALDNHKKMVQTLKAEIEAMKKGKPAEDPEKKTLLERIQQEEERRKALEQELGAVSYEKTEEYKSKFVKPMEKAFKTAYEEIGRLQALNSEGEARLATKEDFQALLIPDYGKAAKLAREIFGENASEALAHRRRIYDLERDRVEALEYHQTNRAQIEANQKIEAEKAAKASAELWQNTTKAQVEKYPQFFGPEDGDEEGNAALQKGFEFTDYVYGNPNLPTEKKIEYHAVIRNKAAAFDRLALRHKRTAERLAELEKELAGFKASVPGPSDGGGEKAPPSNDPFAEIEALANGKG
jgi:hypothetical protein